MVDTSWVTKGLAATNPILAPTSSPYNIQNQILTGVSGSIIAPFFYVGAALNAGTGGTSPSSNVFDYAAGAPGDMSTNPTTAAAYQPTYSNLTQALSGYQGSTPNAGTWGLPILNAKTGDVVEDAIKKILDIVPKWVFPVAVGVAGLYAWGKLGGGENHGSR